MRNALLLLFLFFGSDLSSAISSTMFVPTATQTTVLDPVSEQFSIPAPGANLHRNNDNLASPTATAPLPEPTKKLTWAKIKKHLKRYWQCYAITAVLAALILEHMHTKRASRPDGTKPISGELSAIERFSLYQINLLKSAFAWLQTFSPQKSLRHITRRFQGTPRTVTSLRTNAESLRNKLQNASHKKRIEIYKKLGLRLNVTQKDIFNLPKGLKISVPDEGYEVQVDGYKTGEYVVGDVLSAKTIAGDAIDVMRLYKGERPGADFFNYPSNAMETLLRFISKEGVWYSQTYVSGRGMPQYEPQKTSKERARQAQQERDRLMQQAKELDRLRAQARQRMLQEQQVLAALDPDPIDSDHPEGNEHA